MDDLARLAEQLNLPNSLLIPLAFGMSAYSGVRMAAEKYQAVAKILGPLGRRWTEAREQRIARAANVADLTEQNEKLKARVASQATEIAFLRRMVDDDAYTKNLLRQVEGLSADLDRERHRRELTDAYLDYDVDWHRADEIDRRSSGAADRDVPRHIPLMEFGRQWRARRAQEQENGVTDG